ncbi:hypothetical protein EFV61_09955 [Yersinia enterocolitica]|nr:hypothetical protein [Yersinia enterocolitica]EKN4926773.1 hypothetical protein [Yersinia enterocolitica]EKN4932563.1 hypothetical protein [Yersinia enterocolitica]EKN5014970.1 hypothetical protein [Yersinia enterocolitica]EKN5045947.1 hypothetical protein [Yersinia enterocolitica]
MTDTRHLSSCRWVGCARSPESLTDVSSSGCACWPPSCTLKSIGYLVGRPPIDTIVESLSG